MTLTDAQIDLARSRAIEQIESFGLPGASEAEWGREAVRRLNIHYAQEAAIILQGLDQSMDAEALDAWRVNTLGQFMAAMVE